MNRERLGDWESRLSEEGCGVQCYQECGSTMDVARELVSTGMPERYGLILTKSQSVGRGRQGKVWTPPESGFFGTYIMKTQKGVNQLSGFSLVVGFVVAGVLEGLGCKACLKWPNDVYSAAHDKLCGILIEIVYLESGAAILTGIGINLKGEPPDMGATSVHTLTGSDFTPVDVGQILGPALFDAWEEFERNGFSSFKGRWLKKAIYLNEEISIEVGGIKRQGIMRGVDDSGLLLLEEQGKVSLIASGEIQNLRPMQGRRKT